MQTHADKVPNNKTQPVTSGSSQQADVQFVDNRAEAVAQKKLKDMANNSPQSAQLKAFADIANNSPHVQQLKAYQQMADNNAAAIQRKGALEEEPLQGKIEPIQKKENKTGLPDTLKSGIEHLSGMDISDVKVHYNSSKPAQLQAHAYAQGTDIHVAPGQEKHLPHEAWHVVQQKQGRVKPTLQMKAGINVNDDSSLENEADVMGAKANGLGQTDNSTQSLVQRKNQASGSSIVQMVLLEKFNSGGLKMAIAGERHGDIDAKVETITWNEEKIDLKHEFAKFEIKGGDEKAPKIAPDPRPARLLYAITSMIENINLILTKPVNLGVVLLPIGDPLDENLKYLTGQMESVLEDVQTDLAPGGDHLLGDLKIATLLDLMPVVEAWRVVYGVDKKKRPRKIERALAETCLNGFLLVKDAAEKDLGSGSVGNIRPYDSTDYSLIRSNGMYKTIAKIAASVGRTIYKVGYNHIAEMEQLGLKSTASVEVLNAEQYLTELGTLLDKHQKEKRGYYKA